MGQLRFAEKYNALEESINFYALEGAENYGAQEGQRSEVTLLWLFLLLLKNPL